MHFKKKCESPYNMTVLSHMNYKLLNTFRTQIHNCTYTVCKLDQPSHYCHNMMPHTTPQQQDTHISHPIHFMISSIHLFNQSINALCFTSFLSGLSLTTVHFSTVSHYNSTVQLAVNYASHCLHLQYISVHHLHCCRYGPHYIKQFLAAVGVINFQASAVECPTDTTSTFTHEAPWSSLPPVMPTECFL